MKNSDILLDEINKIDKSIAILQNQKNFILDLHDSFINMGEFNSILEENYIIFNDSINYVIEKITNLNNYVYDNVIEQYFNIYKIIGSEISFNYHKFNEMFKEN